MSMFFVQCLYRIQMTIPLIAQQHTSDEIQTITSYVTLHRFWIDSALIVYASEWQIYFVQLYLGHDWHRGGNTEYAQIKVHKQFCFT